MLQDEILQKSKHHILLGITMNHHIQTHTHTINHSKYIVVECKARVDIIRQHCVISVDCDIGLCL